MCLRLFIRQFDICFSIHFRVPCCVSAAVQILALRSERSVQQPVNVHK